ncbi:MAG: hypothetical protein AAB352_01180 [Patescibacteria group bacterium]
MTEEQSIKQLNKLQEIKPRREWVVLTKNQILGGEAKAVMANKKGILSQLLVFLPRLSYQRQFAYAFASLALIVAGLFGFAQYTVPGDTLFSVRRLTEQSQAALTGQKALQNDIANFNSRVSDLAKVAKDNKVGNIPSAIKEVSSIAKTLKNDLAQNPQSIKEVAGSLQTLAAVSGTDLSENPEVKDLYKVIVENQMKDLKETTLTKEQEKTLLEVEELYKKGDYSGAFVKIYTELNTIDIK